MSETFEINAELREETGKAASRRMRRLTGRIPAVLYGGGKQPMPVMLVRKDLEHSLENEAFYSHILTFKVGSRSEQAILKDLQRHPAKDQIMHADFLRVSDDVKVKVHIPIHFLNEEACTGVKMEGGIIQHQATDLEIQCLPGDMPEFIEVDMADVAVGGIIHISDIKLPPGIESVALSQGGDHDLAIASVLARRGGVDEDLEQDGQEAAEGEAEAEDTDGAEEEQ